LEGKSAQDLVNRLVLSAPIVVNCEACSRLHVLDESGEQLPRVYALEVASDTKY
jgi:hypothetical protein